MTVLKNINGYNCIQNIFGNIVIIYILLAVRFTAIVLIIVYVG